MESKTKKYKIYLIILTIFAIISFIIGYVTYLELSKVKESLDEVYSDLTTGTEEQQQEVLNEFNEDTENEEDIYTREDLLEYIEQYQKGEIYVMLDDGKDPDVISILSMNILSLFNGYMLIIVFVNYLLKRYLKGLNKVLRVLLDIVLVIFMYPLYYYIVALGAIGLPIVIIFCIYKIIRGRKKKPSDKSEEDVKDVLGRVDADEVFDEDKNDEDQNTEE